MQAVQAHFFLRGLPTRLSDEGLNVVVQQLLLQLLRGQTTLLCTTVNSVRTLNGQKGCGPLEAQGGRQANFVDAPALWHPKLWEASRSACACAATASTCFSSLSFAAKGSQEDRGARPCTWVHGTAQTGLHSTTPMAPPIVYPVKVFPVCRVWFCVLGPGISYFGGPSCWELG